MSYFQSSCLLPADMLMEILSWLPVKDVVRLKCISKGWNHLVSDSAFVKLHLLRSPKNTHILLTFDTRGGGYAIAPVQDLLDNPSSTVETLLRNDFPYNPFNRSYTVLGVLNGLVCLQFSWVDDEFEHHWFHMWNPATRAMSIDSPHISFDHSDYKDVFWFMFGFGYDEWSDTYQVLFLDNNKNESQELKVRVWSVGDTCWRNTSTCDAFSTIICPVSRVSRGSVSRGIFVSGTLNWLAFPKSYSYYDNVKMNQLEIFSYHQKEETCRYFPMPDGILEINVCEPELEVLKGCLCLSHHHEGNFTVWLKREFNHEKSWSKLLTLRYEDHYKYLSRDFLLELWIIWMCEDDDDFVLLANRYIDKPDLIRYNTRDNRIDRRELYKHESSNIFSYDYAPSLVFPHVELPLGYFL